MPRRFTTYTDATTLRMTYMYSSLNPAHFTLTKCCSVKFYQRSLPYFLAGRSVTSPTVFRGWTAGHVAYRISWLDGRSRRLPYLLAGRSVTSLASVDVQWTLFPHLGRVVSVAAERVSVVIVDVISLRATCVNIPLTR